MILFVDVVPACTAWKVREPATSSPQPQAQRRAYSACPLATKITENDVAQHVHELVSEDLTKSPVTVVTAQIERLRVHHVLVGF